MNKVILVGRLARDPELRTTNTGKSVATFSLAVDRRFKQEGQPTADFFNIVAWGRQAEVICQYLGKGRQIALTGRLQSRSYDAQDGSKRYVTEVVLEEFDFIGSKTMAAEAAITITLAAATIRRRQKQHRSQPIICL
ncbi:single-stranded DNA-binding protein [Eubacterium callanderi]|uniref:Single-stranded DNA-binding protein n=1 Tax=Eubacterium callanderi TaxID=53442 RepID=A0A853JL37_9FIRM|nr:single-stranded DNA-binding protein [Eubacterium callanderi]